jgi:uncharacterized protein (TIGR00255 family)
MISSMTGFGRGEWQDERWRVTAELRSLNQRGLKISFRLPDALRSQEMALEALIKAKVARGHVYCTVECVPSEAAPELIVDRARLRLYLTVIESLKDELGGYREADPTEVLSLPNVIKREPLDSDAVGEILPQIKGAVEAALEDLSAFRRNEGQHLTDELLRLCGEIGARTDQVAERAPVVVDEYRQKLLARIQKLLQGTGLEVAPEDMHREVAIFADRSDITEEVTRLRSHLAKFAEALESGEAVGRKLEFMSQEMLREANTMASKANDSEIVHAAVDLKTEIDRLREQVMNVE